MASIDQTELPGVGVRYEFDTDRGVRVGVLQHLSGDRELLLYDKNDPDTCDRTVRLKDADAEALADLLGLSQLAQSLGAVREAVGGLVIEWITIVQGGPFEGKTIGDTRLRTQTGVSIIAVIHDSEPIPAPGPEQRLDAGDTVIVIGTLDGIHRAENLLERG
jgi:TrkA domain protein